MCPSVLPVDTPCVDMYLMLIHHCVDVYIMLTQHVLILSYVDTPLMCSYVYYVDTTCVDIILC